MFKIMITGLAAMIFMGCNPANLQETYIGEWAYFVSDTSYCELLIGEQMVFPYHNNELNSYSYKYKIANDTFYIYGNIEGVVESSPINHLGKDSFQILGITPSTLTRLKHNHKSSSSLATYHYKRENLLKNKDINALIAERTFVEMDELKKDFEKNYQERRRMAIYQKNKQQSK
jgi:hypothetical protein